MTARARIRGRLRDQGGFSLTELLVAMILASIFATGLFAFFFSGVDATRTHESQARAQADGRTALARLVREARQAISPDDGLTSPVVLLSPTELVMYVDPSRALTATTPRPHKVRWAVVSGRLVRESAAPVGASAPFTYNAYTGRQTMLAPVQNGATPVFAAATGAGDPLPATPSAAQLREVGRIAVRLVVGQRSGGTTSTLELSTDVALRNA
ncbi:PilW family protein [Miltoncostaea marina]|uniref:PilW family protein n=1 Tax=Miltoncostaea marina TaxID=2843215 RepID=UPI001C3D8865|nr:prepilin-type N-terminal cleavage/methylation domain-containing protein [Miltoncostaea marina]